MTVDREKRHGPVTGGTSGQLASMMATDPVTNLPGAAYHGAVSRMVSALATWEFRMHPRLLVFWLFLLLSGHAALAGTPVLDWGGQLRRAVPDSLLGEAGQEPDSRVSGVRLVGCRGKTCNIAVEIRVGLYVKGALMLRTEDAGLHWEPVTELDGLVTETFVLDPEHIWILTHWVVEGTFPILYVTIDGGKSWRRESGIDDFLRSQDRCCAAQARGIFFRNALYGMILADGDFYLETKDGGHGWRLVSKGQRPGENYTWYAPDRQKNAGNEGWTVKKAGTFFEISRRSGDRTGKSLPVLRVKKTLR